MSVDAAQLFEAFGFEKVTDRLWWFGRTFEQGDEVSKAIVAVRIDRHGDFTGYVPMVQDVVYEEFIKEVPQSGLFFKSSDPRDLVALAQNEVASAMIRTEGVYPDVGFKNAEGDMWVSLPYADLQYGDYVVINQTGDYKELADPVVEYGAAYTAWREEFCAELVSTPAPGR